MRPSDDELREWRGAELTRRVLSLVKDERTKWTEQSCVGRQAADSHRLASFRDGVIAGLGFVLDLGVQDDVSTTKARPG